MKEPPTDDRTPDDAGAQSEFDTGNDSGMRQATQLVRLCDDAELFHWRDVGYATITRNGHGETWPVRQKAFRGYLAKGHFDRTGKTPGSQAVQDALNVIEGRCLYGGDEHDVFIRIAQADGRIYLDLCNVDWQVVEITATGWRVISDPPVRFRRTKGMEALPVPVLGGSLDDLRPFINVGSDGDFALMVGWLIGAFRPESPVPVLVVNGEQGSAKTTACRVLRSLIDPNGVPLRAEPRNGHDLMIAANNSRIIALDNMSYIQPWLSNAICRLSTGGGFATRTLYENDEETLFDALRPIMVNGIEDLATRSDLLDRAIQLTLPTIPDDRRRTEKELWAEFTRARPRILGALMDAVCAALRDVETTELDTLPRMADFAQWVVAGESACPWAPGLFLNAYSGNRDAAHDLAIEASLIGPVLRGFIESVGQWEGTISDLLGHLNEQLGLTAKTPKGWPTRPNGLSGQLRRIAPNLRAIGIEVEFHPRTKAGRLVSIRSEPQNSVTTVTSVTGERDQANSVREGDRDAPIGDDDDADDGDLQVPSEESQTWRF